ncbi:xylulokinase [Enterococcus alishanensis]
MEYVLGIDLGTSSLKGIVMNQEGSVEETASTNYVTFHPQSGFSEQDPKVWIEAFHEVLTELLAKKPALKENLVGISFSGQMHSLVVLDEQNQVLRNAILWNDVRTTEQTQKITEYFGDELLKITKNIALEGFTLPKILWIQEHEPDVWLKVRHLLLPKDYLNYHLTDKMTTDYSDAAGTLLLDMQKKEWSTEILKEFNIPREYLPDLKESNDQTGILNHEIKQKYGFEREIKVFAGGADNACGAAASGIFDEEMAMLSIGTSGVFLSFEKNVTSDYNGKLHLFSHVFKNGYYSMGVTLAAGDSLSWYKNTFAIDSTFDELISEIPTSSEGLYFTPYISGERTPYADSKIRGSFIGIDTRHQRGHFTRAVLEGIVYSLKDIQVLMRNVSKKSFTKIVSVGGGAKSSSWLQIQADILNIPIVCLKTEMGPGFGAAMIAAVGIGWYDSIIDCGEKIIEYTEPIYPIEENVKRYKKLYSIYQQIYPATRSICHMSRN